MAQSNKKKLVVVESPGKVKKIQKILGSGYIVKPSVGHIMDLPQKGLGIDIKNNFEPTYKPIPKKKDAIREIKTASKKVDEVFLCMDPDREGEWIAESVRRLIETKTLTIHRATFNSITKTEIQKAIASPSTIDKNLVEAQQSRRLLDRLTGFKISPLLWRQKRDKNEKSRSAGRVQSVGLQMIVDRQKEIDEFVPQKYWTVEALVSDGTDEFVLNLQQKNKLSIDSQEKADKIVATLNKHDFIVSSVDKKQEQKKPMAPFTTSVLQQTCSGMFNWSSKQTMAVAQKLYEGGHCVAPDTLITTGKGEICSIEQLVKEKGCNIVGVDEEGCSAVLDVQNYSVRSAPEKLYRIVTDKNHEIVTTSRHPFLRLDGAEGQAWVEAKDLQTGEYVGCQQTQKIAGCRKTIFDLLYNLPTEEQRMVLVFLKEEVPREKLQKWAQQEDVATSTYYKYLRNRTLTLYNYLQIRSEDKEIDKYYLGLRCRSSQSELVFPDLHVTPEMMRWIGLILGDGHIGKGTITCYKPDITSQMYAEYYGAFTGDYTIRKSNKTPRISNIFLRALGYNTGAKASVLFIPRFLYDLDIECIRGFVAGLMDSDGSIKMADNGVSAKISISSRSKLFIECLRILLLRLGITSSRHTCLAQLINKQNEEWSRQHKKTPIVARGDQHYLYLNSGSWERFDQQISRYLINRRAQAQNLKEVRLQSDHNRNKECFVPINAYIEKVRTQKGITKQALGQVLGVNYWNYYGKIRSNRTRLSFFNKEQITAIGEYLEDELLQELGTNDIIWQRIKRIDVIDNADGQYCKKVYDLTTAQHNFTANGFVTHNCTYMRTDSVTIADEAVKDIRTLIPNIASKSYLPAKALVHKTKSKAAQEAHEAIRATDLSNDLPQVLANAGVVGDEKKLLELIWRRTVASQMAHAVFDKVEVVVIVPPKTGKLKLRAIGQTQKFDGYLKIWTYTDTKENVLPGLKVGQKLDKIKVEAKEHETKPPARYNNASLVKELEANGVGRPSTYASIIETLLHRGYVTMDKKAFVPTDKGKEVAQFLKDFFPNIINVGFTCKMEAELDNVASGNKTRLELLEEFYKELKDTISGVREKLSMNEVSEEPCPECGKQLYVRLNRKENQRFLSCSNKECKHTYNMDKDGKPVEREVEKLDEKCPKCGGDLIKRKGKFGIFYGCSGYRDGCKVTADEDGNIKLPKKVKKAGKKCKKCKKGDMVERTNKASGDKFWGCSRYPKCKNVESIDSEEADED